MLAMYVSRVTPDSRTAVTLKAKSVGQHSVARSAVRLRRSTRKRSPDRVDMELVGSEGIFLTSKTMVNAVSPQKLSLEMLGTPGRALELIEELGDCSHWRWVGPILRSDAETCRWSNIC